MRDWFGEVPAFIMTLAADYCAQCSDEEFCYSHKNKRPEQVGALLGWPSVCFEHQLY